MRPLIKKFCERPDEINYVKKKTINGSDQNKKEPIRRLLNSQVYII